MKILSAFFQGLLFGGGCAIIFVAVFYLGVSFTFLEWVDMEWEMARGITFAIAMLSAFLATLIASEE